MPRAGPEPVSAPSWARPQRPFSCKGQQTRVDVRPLAPAEAGPTPGLKDGVAPRQQPHPFSVTETDDCLVPSLPTVPAATTDCESTGALEPRASGLSPLITVASSHGLLSSPWRPAAVVLLVAAATGQQVAWCGGHRSSDRWRGNGPRAAVCTDVLTEVRLCPHKPADLERM